jgi:hypothetical protein
MHRLSCLRPPPFGRIGGRIWLESLVGLFLLLGCSSESPSAGETLPAEEPDPGPPGHQLGMGDGSPQSVRLVVVFHPARPQIAADLAFDPLRPSNLWVLLRQFHDNAPCTEAVRQGCDTLDGSVAIVTNPAGPAPTFELKVDPNAWHFMRLPTSLAFGKNGNFATCGEARTGNWENEEADYMGPTLWSSDPRIFAIEPPGQNGSHLDMLHETPFCMGIAFERDRVYWTFNGQLGAIDRYDFKQPHEPGGEDHSDGEIQRWVEGELLRQPNVPSHMAFDAKRARLYVADTGHQRVVALDVKSGTLGSEIAVLEPMASHRAVTGGVLKEIVPPGVLTAPSGLEFKNDVLFVTDNATGRIWAFDPEGVEIRRLDTGLAPGSLGGIAVGPDHLAYISNLQTGEALRIDPL